MSKIYNIRNRARYGNNWYGKNGERRKIVKLLRGIQNGNCNICKHALKGEDTVDHILQLSDGGKHEIENMQLLCPECHISKDKESMDLHGVLKIRTWC